MPKHSSSPKNYAQNIQILGSKNYQQDEYAKNIYKDGAL
jgi:hypothetical protein